MLKRIYEFFGIEPIYSQKELNRMRYGNFVKSEYGTFIKSDLNMVRPNDQFFKIIRNARGNHKPMVDEEK
jgi:hypothetical protein